MLGMRGKELMFGVLLWAIIVVPLCYSTAKNNAALNAAMAKEGK